MNTSQPNEQQESSFTKFNNWVKNSVTIRLISITILVLLLLIPASMIKSLINERQWTHEEALTEVSSKWGLQQTIAGPVVSVPYYRYYKNEDDELVRTTDYMHFLPEDLKIEGKVDPEKRKRGIYEVVLYNTVLDVSGSFEAPDVSGWKIQEQDILWENAFLSVGVNDMRGIKESIVVNWNGKNYTMDPGVETNQVLQSGVSTNIPVKANSDTTASKNYEFSFQLNINGSRELMFAPLGENTNVSLESNWPDPSFDGFTLPDKREVSAKGFSADWQVLHLNRNYPQQWIGTAHNIHSSTFGVKLLLPVDHYLKSMRSAKYAIMIISLTFLTFFFIEILNKKRIHPVQYILVGLALCIFYALLLAFSEHVGFNLAYLIGCVMVVGLIAVYAKSVFKDLRTTGFFTALLLVLFGFVFTILQLQDYALLMGSIGLFIVLAIVMFLSRKIDWYNLSGNK